MRNHFWKSPSFFAAEPLGFALDTRKATFYERSASFEDYGH
jgi:hypothetical protein